MTNVLSPLNDSSRMPSTAASHVLSMRLRLFIAGVLLTGFAAQSFAANADRARAAVSIFFGIVVKLVGYRLTLGRPHFFGARNEKFEMFLHRKL